MTAPADSSFAGLVARLSEPGGYFDTDNLISNESAYAQIAGILEAEADGGGAYLGVGPDQNFSYIAILRPDIAFIVDIRRDNLLQHLFYKALYTVADDRLEYLCLWLARDCGDAAAAEGEWTIEALLAVVDAAPAGPAVLEAARRRVEPVIRGFGVPLDDADVATIRSIHERFAAAGSALRFQSHRRAPQPHYPTLRRLLLATDPAGRQRSYLADDASFETVRSLQLDDRIVPVVGDLAGPHAVRAIGAEAADRGLRVNAIYASNVEDYLIRDRAFDRWIDNVAALPVGREAVIIRSFFHNRSGHPHALPGHGSTQVVQRIRTMLDEARSGGYRSYFDLATRSVLPPSG